MIKFIRDLYRFIRETKEEKCNAVNKELKSIESELFSALTELIVEESKSNKRLKADLSLEEAFESTSYDKARNSFMSVFEKYVSMLKAYSKLQSFFNQDKIFRIETFFRFKKLDLQIYRFCKQNDIDYDSSQFTKILYLQV